jgi:hypothetical protein
MCGMNWRTADESKELSTQCALEQQSITPITEFRVYVKDCVFSIKPDGTIWINPKYSVTEAAKCFWDEVINTNPFPIKEKE